MGRDHRAVRRFIKLYAKAGQPLNGLRRFGDQFIQKVLLRREVSAAVGIQKMLRGRVVRLVRRLNAALGHHRVRVAHAKLCDQQHLRARVVGFDRCRAARAAAADDQNVRVIVHALQMRLFKVNSRLAL